MMTGSFINVFFLKVTGEVWKTVKMSVWFVWSRPIWASKITVTTQSCTAAAAESWWSVKKIVCSHHVAGRRRADLSCEKRAVRVQGWSTFISCLVQSGQWTRLIKKPWLPSLAILIFKINFLFPLQQLCALHRGHGMPDSLSCIFFLIHIPHWQTECDCLLCSSV